MAEPTQTRYARCQYVVGDVLTDLMRAYMMFSKIPFDTIDQTIMGDMRFRKKINQKEIGKLQTLSTHGFADFDISLMFKIARHKRFAMIIPDRPTHGWDSFPQEGDNTIGDNIQRITICRNEINHIANTTLSEDEFSKMFEKYIDIGTRADIILRKNNNHFTNRITNYKTCSLDKEMEDKYRVEIENLKKVAESEPRLGTTVKVYANKETQTKIGNIRAEESFEETSSAKITLSGIENPAEKARYLNNQKDNIKTDNIEMTEATEGSLVIFLKIRNRLFQDDHNMESELSQFVECLFVKADLRCIKNYQCNLSLEIPDAESNTDESDNGDDIVLHVEIKHGAFKTDESLSQNLDQFMSNVVTKVNGKPSTSHTEVISLLDISDTDSTQCGDKLQEEAKGSDMKNIQSPIKNISALHAKYIARIYKQMVFNVTLVVLAVFVCFSLNKSKLQMLDIGY